MKKCALCGEDKPLADYYKNSRAKDGLFTRCKPCVKARQKTYNVDPEKKKAKQKRENASAAGKAKNKRWRERNREKVLEFKRRYRERNPDAWDKWYAANRDAVLERNRANYDAAKKRAERTPEQSALDRDRRRARLLNAYIEDVPFDYILQRDLGICGICLKPILERTIELDHIIPLAAGGMHERTNVQLAHRSCNRRKWKSVDETLFRAA